MNSSLPLVSIITPCYNSVKFIEHCIRSVLAQDYPNIEHIIQDGASTDGTIDILKKYNDHVDWVSNPDNGQSDGLNRALQRCNGDIFCVLNADDELLPHAASWAVDNFTKYPEVAVIYGDQYDIGLDGKIINKTFGPEYDFEKIFCVENVIPAQAAFIKSVYLKKVGFYADVTRKTCPDYEMWVRIGLKFPMIHIPGFVCKYRWHPRSEGHRASIIPEMVKSKLEVISRVVSNPDITDSVKSLNKRAHSGALWWGGCVLQFNRKNFLAFKFFVHSFIVNPSLKNFFKLLNVPFISLVIAIMTFLVFSTVVCISLREKGLSYRNLTVITVLLLFFYYKGLRFIYYRNFELYRAITNFTIISMCGFLIGLLLWLMEKSLGPVVLTYFYMIVLTLSFSILIYKSIRFIKRNKIKVP